MQWLQGYVSLGCGCGRLDGNEKARSHLGVTIDVNTSHRSLARWGVLSVPLQLSFVRLLVPFPPSWRDPSLQIILLLNS